MKISTIRIKGRDQLSLWTESGLLPVSEINAAFGTGFPGEMLKLISSGRIEDLSHWLNSAKIDKTVTAGLIDPSSAEFAPCYRRPRKIWGIGLNYREHAVDLDETAPEAEPASFMKPDTSIIGCGDTIRIPFQSRRTTAEAELAVIIGRECRNIEREDWIRYVAGFTPVLDMTAEDILRKNPRYLTRAKSFDTFFSFGPQLVTPDHLGELEDIRIKTVINGKVRAENSISNMVHPPDRLVWFHSRVMTLLPGDIISTGTPGAAVISDGDTVESVIEGFAPLVNRVTDLKKV
ncbi:MAG: fumarylacetoacetate hydrolase [Candidatus Latescibacteria bacterium]|nr:fumarylacetoacetate hydrolase [bacterium]MBD3423055.1 fumarylacetoacetate hydrolase [Candidatus Latescibacterota bacterium]